MPQAIIRGDGRTIDHTPVAALLAGAVVVQGPMIGIAVDAIAASQLGALMVQGVADMAKVTGAITAGAAVYWDADGDPVGGTAGTGALTTTATNNTFAGFAVAAAASGDTTVRTVLYGVATVTGHNSFTYPITDPGNAGAIPVTASGYVPIVTAGAETRTLAAPSALGQVLNIHMKTDGGDCVITCATAINQTGNNTITLNDAGDSVTLIAKGNGANIRWSVLANDGATLSTV